MYDASGNRSDVMLVLILLSCFTTMETDNEGKTPEESKKGRWTRNMTTDKIQFWQSYNIVYSKEQCKLLTYSA